MIFDTSAIEQTHGFALFLRCWWMEARDIPAGLRQSVTSLVYKLRTDMLLQNIHIQNLWNLHFRLLSTGVVWPKIIFDLWRCKKRELENNLTIFENRIIKYCRRFLKKIDISGSIGPNKSLKTGKFSLAQASVKWKFVTDAPDVFGLFLSPSRFCFHACR